LEHQLTTLWLLELCRRKIFNAKIVTLVPEVTYLMFHYYKL
jgi:hypothetical protein